MKIDRMNVHVRGHHDALDPSDGDCVVEAVSVSGPAGGKSIDVSGQGLACPLGAARHVADLLTGDEVDPWTLVVVGGDQTSAHYSFSGRA
jgi:hypothetical protein